MRARETFEGRPNASQPRVGLRALTETYVDGAGLFAYHQNPGGTGYDVVSIPWEDRRVDLDHLVHSIADDITGRAAAGDHLVVVEPTVTAVDVRDLTPDEPEE